MQLDFQGLTIALHLAHITGAKFSTFKIATTFFWVVRSKKFVHEIDSTCPLYLYVVAGWSIFGLFIPFLFSVTFLVRSPEPPELMFHAVQIKRNTPL